MRRSVINRCRLHLPPIVLYVRAMDDHYGGVCVKREKKATYHSLDNNGVGIKCKRPCLGFVRGSENLIVLYILDCLGLERGIFQVLLWSEDDAFLRPSRCGYIICSFHWSSDAHSFAEA